MTREDESHKEMSVISYPNIIIIKIIIICIKKMMLSLGLLGFFFYCGIILMTINHSLIQFSLYCNTVIKNHSVGTKISTNKINYYKYYIMGET